MEEFLENSSVRLLKDQSELIDQKFYLIGREDPQRAEKLGDEKKNPRPAYRKAGQGETGYCS